MEPARPASPRRSYGPGPDGIPGCFGDNGAVPNACNDVLGDPNNPGNTGSDDVAIPYPNPKLAGNGGVFDPSAPATIRGTSGGYVFGPSATVQDAFPDQYVPTLSLRRATSQRDVFVLGPDTVDTVTKAASTLCPIVVGEPECSPPDPDRDGILGSEDNCPFVANPGQEDTGGINTSTPDGIGNVCQCGDVTGQGIVNGQDGFFIIRHELGFIDPLFVQGGNCDVGGDGYCNGQDGMFATRAALGFVDPLHLAPQGQRCHNANPQAPACPSCSPCPSGTCS